MKADIHFSSLLLKTCPTDFPYIQDFGGGGGKQGTWENFNYAQSTEIEVCHAFIDPSGTIHVQSSACLQHKTYLQITMIKKWQL